MRCYWRLEILIISQIEEAVACQKRNSYIKVPLFELLYQNVFVTRIIASVTFIIVNRRLVIVKAR